MQQWDWSGSPSPSLVADSFLYVGSDAVGHVMDGTADEVRVYSSAQPTQLAADKAQFVIPVAPAPSPSDLIASYSFDDSTSLGRDDSGNSNSLSRSGHASYTGAGYGMTGGASFDGTTSTYLETSKALNLNNDGLTVEAWVNMTSVANLQGIVTESETTTYTGYGFGLYVQNGNVRFIFNDNSYSGTTTATITPGVWHFLALTYNPGANPNRA